MRTSLGPAAARERLVDAAGDEVERRSALHLERHARVVREDERGDVIRRLLSPPPAPRLVRPRTTHRTEHVAAEDPRAVASHAARGEVLVDAGASSFHAVHRAEGQRVGEPPVELHSVFAERMLEPLIGTRAKSIDGHGERSDANLGHDATLPLDADGTTGRSCVPRSCANSA